MNKCGTCNHYTGAGDWNLCCTVQHPTPKEKEMGKTFILDIYAMKIRTLVTSMTRKESY